MKNSQNKKQNYTHLYKIFFVLSIAFLIFFGLLTLFSFHKKLFLEENYKNLSETQPSFATLSEYHPIVVAGRKKHIYTYLVPDNKGKLYEVVEMADPILHKRLRVGDSIPIRKKIIYYFSKKIVIAKIENNSESVSISTVPLHIGYFGIGFGMIFLLTSFGLKVVDNGSV
ncbi:MAG: hypothetical protein L6Q54_06835 [Leptospiraceae bacterium]|nr:hypothetical protein [Leptospiraceae bacterium]MCK6380953.1 hypothetical protein [Leptospiraceae bacterium]NUM40952.1 hypothetical protein [Leptospiraceae bacterium]